MANRVIKAAKQIKIRDVFAPIVFLLVLVPSLMFRLINCLLRRKLWLIAEEGEARDNGYHFYKYVREKHPKDYCFYAIKPESAGYKKVEKLGNVIKWGSLKHWLYYMSANLNISSQKSGNPCPIFWYVVHVKLGLYRNRVFLQHGITQNDAKFIYYNQTKFKYFVCGAKQEYEYLLRKFGYKKEQLLLTGFPRWDNLKDTSKEQKNKSILIMPTWRNWLGGERNRFFGVKDFLDTDFYKKWSAFLNDQDFINYIEKNNIIAYFYPHINMYSFIDSFKSSSKNIRVASTAEDIQEYFNKCSLMITDYSSVAFDFAYLGKPVIYYQFDIHDFRKKQYREGYFSYEDDGFGPVCRVAADVVKAVVSLRSIRQYSNRAREFFDFQDSNNSKRVYEAIK